MKRQIYSNTENVNGNYSNTDNYVNKNFTPKKSSSHATLGQMYDFNKPPAIIYKKQDRICPKKGNNFFFLGVS